MCCHAHTRSHVYWGEGKDNYVTIGSTFCMRVGVVSPCPRDKCQTVFDGSQLEGGSNKHQWMEASMNGKCSIMSYIQRMEGGVGMAYT